MAHASRAQSLSSQRKRKSPCEPGVTPQTQCTQCVACIRIRLQDTAPADRLICFVSWSWSVPGFSPKTCICFVFGDCVPCSRCSPEGSVNPEPRQQTRKPCRNDRPADHFAETQAQQQHAPGRRPKVLMLFQKRKHPPVPLASRYRCYILRARYLHRSGTDSPLQCTRYGLSTPLHRPSSVRSKPIKAGRLPSSCTTTGCWPMPSEPPPQQPPCSAATAAVVLSSLSGDGGNGPPHC